MSRIGKALVKLPTGVKVAVKGNEILVEGKNGKISFPLFPNISVTVDGDTVQVVNAAEDDRKARALHGLVRAHLANMVKGVHELWERKLVIEGVGYNAKIQGKQLVMQIGFCHPVEMPFPTGVTAECPKATQIVIKGVDRQQVGQYAANIRRVRPPEPYKGKGIRYHDEVVRRKPGKTLTSGG